jgi:hypothetical protein
MSVCSMKEFFNFAGKLIAKRVPAGVQVVDYEGNNCVVLALAEGISAIAIGDKEYPARVAVTMLKEALSDFRSIHP